LISFGYTAYIACVDNLKYVFGIPSPQHIFNPNNKAQVAMSDLRRFYEGMHTSFLTPRKNYPKQRNFPFEFGAEPRFIPHKEFPLWEGVVQFLVWEARLQLGSLGDGKGEGYATLL
jgi:hypothetical protein